MSSSRALSDVLVKLARCCTPVPGDDIIGFVTKTAGVSVHRKDCTNAGDLLGQPERLVDVEWAPTSQSTFLVQIMVEALDRARLLSDITLALSEQHVNILSASLTTTRDRVAKSRFSLRDGRPQAPRRRAEVRAPDRRCLRRLSGHAVAPLASRASHSHQAVSVGNCHDTPAGRLGKCGDATVPSRIRPRRTFSRRG